jgi:hypothetical protein
MGYKICTNMELPKHIMNLITIYVKGTQDGIKASQWSSYTEKGGRLSGLSLSLNNTPVPEARHNFNKNSRGVYGRP